MSKIKKGDTVLIKVGVCKGKTGRIVRASGTGGVVQIKGYKYGIHRRRDWIDNGGDDGWWYDRSQMKKAKAPRKKPVKRSRYTPKDINPLSALI